MKILKDLLNICVTLPNMDLFVFYFVFILLVPLLLIGIGETQLLNTFLVMLVPIAVVLTESGKPKLFNKLYSKEYIDLTSYISKLLISFISLSSILYISITLGYQYNNIIYGMITGIISIIIVFFLCREIIPIIIEKGDTYIKDNFKLNYRYNWHKYIIGICSILIFIILEIILGETVLSIL